MKEYEMNAEGILYGKAAIAEPLCLYNEQSSKA